MNSAQMQQWCHGSTVLSDWNPIGRLWQNLLVIHFGQSRLPYCFLALAHHFCHHTALALKLPWWLIGLELAPLYLCCVALFSLCLKNTAFRWLFCGHKGRIVFNCTVWLLALVLSGKIGLNEIVVLEEILIFKKQWVSFPNPDIAVEYSNLFAIHVGFTAIPICTFFLYAYN